jgi:glutathione S-transferase
MKLYYTPNSPYARMCRIVADLAGLTDRVELEWVKLRSPDNTVIAKSPMGRVPVLIDGDLVLTESRNICAYLDEKGGEARTVALYGNWKAVASEAEALAFLDAITVWSREVRRAKGEQSPFLIQVEDEQARRELAHLNATLVAPTGSPPLSFETICLLTAFGMMRFYELVPDWRETYPNVAAWADAYDTLPIVADTAPSAAALNPLSR